MNLKKICTIILLTLVFPQTAINAQDQSKVDLVELPAIPGQQEQTPSLGYVGMQGGVHNGIILAAGGANFPNGLPWEGGQKEWSNTIFLYESNAWHATNDTLPQALAYGASVSLPEGILVLGGENGQLTSDQVYLISIDPITKQTTFNKYPSIP